MITVTADAISQMNSILERKGDAVVRYELEGGGCGGYIGRWDTDYRDWIPEVYETGIQWNHVVDPTYGDIELTMTLTEGPNQFKDLWTPVGEETTEWREVPYPK